MLALFPDRQRYKLLIRPVQDWAQRKKVTIEVFRRFDGTGLGISSEKDWESIYFALATMPDQNEHQLAAMAKGLDKGRTLRFEVDWRESDLERIGFESNSESTS